MIIEALRALALAGIPLFVISYIVISRAIRSERLGDFSDAQSMETALKDLAKSHKQEKKVKDNKHKSHLLLNKWLFFGGGFYGLMALVTYAYIEIKEIGEFLSKIFDLEISQVFSSISINMLVDFFINSIMNLVDAFVWFMYWQKVIAMQNGWIWLIAAYVGYSAGARLARHFPLKFRLRRFVWQKLGNK